MTQVKICGLTRAGDAAAAEAAGAVYGGVILAPGSPRTVTPGRVLEIFDGSGLERVGVFVNEARDRIADLAAGLGLAVVQLHGDESPEFAAAIGAATGAEVWKAIRPRDAAEFVSAATKFEGAVAGLLVDGWSAAARGGTGARFPWREVAAHRAGLGTGTRLIAAGGLGPDNVAEVISILDPDVVDVSSGVERSAGEKDEVLIRRFAAAAGAAAAQKRAG
ncbi:MAG: phosphoribosylanthranilate isomerase [Gemmatimonadota bacterium]